VVYARKKTRKNGKDYWYLCKSERNGSKVTQKTIKYLSPASKMSKEEAKAKAEQYEEEKEN